MARNFFESMKNRMGIGDPERNSTDCYERGRLIVPKCIRANEGEIPVRQYNIAVLRTLLSFQRAEGRLQVTNKRLIFRAAGRAIGGRTTLQHEYAISEIAGIEARKEYAFSWLHLIGGILLLFLTWSIGISVTGWVCANVAVLNTNLAVFTGIVFGLLFCAANMISFFTIPKEFLLKLVILGLTLGSMSVLSGLSVFSALSQLLSFGGNFGGTYSIVNTISGVAVLPIIILILNIIVIFVTAFGLLLFVIRPNLVISIKNKMSTGDGPVDIRRATLRSESTGFSEVIPTEEAERAIREIGAIIGDIQKLGDYGVEKWVRK